MSKSFLSNSLCISLALQLTGNAPVTLQTALAANGDFNGNADNMGIAVPGARLTTHGAAHTDSAHQSTETNAPIPHMHKSDSP